MTRAGLILAWLILAACAGTDEQRYGGQDAYLKELDNYRIMVRECEASGRRIVILHKNTTRIKRGLSSEDLRRAQCR